MIPGVRQEAWRVVNTITSAQANPTTDKSYATLSALAAAKIAMCRVPEGAIALDVRFRGTATNNDSNTVEVYAMRGESDHFTRICTLTLTTGTQIYSSGVLFVDTIATSNEVWTDDIVPVSPANNDIAHVAFNTHGYRYFLFIVSTLNSTSVIVEVAEE